MPETLVDAWRHIIVGEKKSWVLFEHGTCVILMKPEADLAAQATVIMREWGPVFPGSPAGDFTVVTLTEYPSNQRMFRIQRPIIPNWRRSS
ncbi:MAG: hypothetical protein ABIY70_09190 [Capsulimonas sp.]|uniref:hypothetical protein n=1 Tax=Capsulimonas sp. TaxID=2494211 RepID=UPI003266519A